jgi:hypothetical protein
MSRELLSVRKTALYVLKLLVIQDHLLGGKACVGGLEDELSID